MTTCNPSAPAPGRGEVAAVSTATGTVRGHPLKIAANPGDILIAPDGKTAYVSGAAGGPYSVRGPHRLRHPAELARPRERQR